MPNMFNEMLKKLWKFIYEIIFSQNKSRTDLETDNEILKMLNQTLFMRAFQYRDVMSKAANNHL